MLYKIYIINVQYNVISEIVISFFFLNNTSVPLFLSPEFLLFKVPTYNDVISIEIIIYYQLYLYYTFCILN